MTRIAPAPAADPSAEQRPPLGRNYWRLFSASTISNLGDGIDAAALPLLAATLTRDPLLFSGIAVLNRLPWLLFTLHAGALADRLDRRVTMVVAALGRALLFGALGLAVLGDFASIWLLYAITFATGVLEVVADTSAQAIVPALVKDRDQLERANGRLFGAQTVADQFVGPPVGGLLFAVAAAVPILLDAATFVIAAVLLVSMTGAYATSRAGDTTRARTSMREDIREGITWLRAHRLLRTLALLLGTMNGLTAAAFAIWPLFVLERLGLGPLGFGLLLTAAAAGSVVGSLVAGRIVERVGRAPALWVTLIASAVVPLAQGLFPEVWVFATGAVVFGFAAVIWNVITVSLRQTIIPDDLLGRVNSVYRFLGWGSMPLGALIGGVLADSFGLRAPFLVGGAVMLLALLPAARVLTPRSIEDARAAAAQTR